VSFGGDRVGRAEAFNGQMVAGNVMGSEEVLDRLGSLVTQRPI
jgi:hypothetical protein